MAQAGSTLISSIASYRIVAHLGLQNVLHIFTDG